MVEELFITYPSHLSQEVQEDFEEDDAWLLRSCITLDDLFTDGTDIRRFTIEDFYSFAKSRVVFIAPDAAITVSNDTPSHHKYTIDITFSFLSTKVQRTFHVSSVNAEESSPALNFLLRLILQESGEAESANIDGDKINDITVIFKCFATTPRQQLGRLDISSSSKHISHKRKISSLTPSSHNTINIDLRFLALNKAHCQCLFNETSDIFSRVKLSQCEINGWTACGRNGADKESRNGTESPKHKRDGRSQKLVLSCTQQEFRKFAEGQLWKSTETFVTELQLVLHFMLADSDIHHLETIVRDSESLESLSIDFLDLDDKTWTSICNSLRSNQTLESIELAYTEKFADSYRRLTPERRRNRTNDIVQLLKVNKSLYKVDWPKFQHDESLIPSVEKLLMENKKRNSSHDTKE
jgi:hypothetical protein